MKIKNIWNHHLVLNSCPLSFFQPGFINAWFQNLSITHHGLGSTGIQMIHFTTPTLRRIKMEVSQLNQQSLGSKVRKGRENLTSWLMILVGLYIAGCVYIYIQNIYTQHPVVIGIKMVFLNSLLLKLDNLGNFCDSTFWGWKVGDVFWG